MIKKIISFILITAFIIQLPGCSITQSSKVHPAELKLKDYDITYVVLLTGEHIKFYNKAKYDTKEKIIIGKKFIREGTSENNWDDITEPVRINASEVLYANVKITSVLPTVFVNMVICFPLLALIGLIILLSSFSSHSCPLIYIFDGEGYILSAEPLDGAICKGLKRTDFSKLEKIQSQEGYFRLILTGQPGETEYIDQLKLYEV
ncbi:MAG: hypothetical protein WCT77_08830, partial [Bacteroidota bacterium]